MLFNEEGSSVDCTIEDTKLKREEKDKRGEDSYLYTQAVFCDSAAVDSGQRSWRFQGQFEGQLDTVVVAYMRRTVTQFVLYMQQLLYQLPLKPLTALKTANCP